MQTETKIILIHGNGGATHLDHWFPRVQSELEELGPHVIAKTMPDNQLARARYWLPQLEKMGADESTVIIGHSSGAVAAMRYAEGHRLLGSVLVGACYTDLGDADEKASGYYDEPWNWEKIKKNQKWILQFASTDDPYIPIEEARHIHKELETEYQEFNNRGHFMDKSGFPELVAAITAKLL